ncbi:MAG: 30S ribosomal protein S20 [Veillonellaceae bacterium]|nr:30S ribosomal protein S20 [Veillonellaceae bacterium]MDD6923450.1 30S ribosomal protein S20 [Veillonellaceae bacterium]
MNYLPNIKASILSVKSDAKRHARNVAEKDRVRLASRKVLDAVEAGNADEAKSLLKEACKTIDMAAANHVYHKNCASRKKSRLARKVNKLAK